MCRMRTPDGGGEHPPADAGMDAEAGGEHPDASMDAEAGGEHPPADAGMDAEAGGKPPDVCVASSDDGPPKKAADVPGALVGAWRLCSDAIPDPEVLWLLGGTDGIQMDQTTWQRGAATASPLGLYFQIMEGTNVWFHFIDPDLSTNTGGDFSATIFTGSGVLELAGCDGPASCAAPASRFVRAGTPGE